MLLSHPVGLLQKEQSDVLHKQLWLHSACGGKVQAQGVSTTGVQWLSLILGDEIIIHYETVNSVSFHVKKVKH